MFNPIYYCDEKFAIISDSMVQGVDPYRYMVSNYGKILDLQNQRQLSINFTGGGYLSVTIHTKVKKVKTLLHRLVAMGFVPGNWSLQVNHIDGNKLNNYYKNLEWVTTQENLLHAVNNDLNYRGQDKPNAIITNNQARIICLGLQNRLRVQEILKEAGLEDNDSTRGIIADIKRGKSFTFISKYYDIDELALRDRELSNEQVKIICQKLQEDPSLTPSELTDIIGYDNLTGKSRISIRNKIGSIKLRKAYTDISKDYKW